MKDVFDSVETDYKRCEKCGVCYRYQETARGICNYNNTFLIGVDICLLWRYIYDKIQYSVVEIKSSKSGMHQSEVAWQQANSANNPYCKREKRRKSKP